MKYILTLGLFVAGIVLHAQSFVSPIGFVETEENKKKVIAYIQAHVKEEYSKLGMDDPSTLRLMEQENLKAFKELVTVTNTSLLSRVIKTYCDLGMCSYDTILMMYKEENKASKQTLEW